MTRSNKTPKLVAVLYILALGVGPVVGATVLWVVTARLVRCDQDKWRSRRGRSRE